MSHTEPRYGAIGRGEERDSLQAANEPAQLNDAAIRRTIFLLALFTVGSHFGKHALSGLGPDIMRQLFVKRLQFGFLFSLQELPGIVLPVVGGVALTFVPHAAAAVVLASSVCLATALCALAVRHNSYHALLFARFLSGLADGALVTVQGGIVAQRFNQSKVSTAFGITLMLSRLSSFAGLSIPPLISERLGLEAAMWTAFAFCIPSVTATILYSLTWRHDFIEEFPERATSPPEQQHRISAVIRSLGLPFWLVTYIWVAVAGAIFSFIHFAPDAFASHFGILASTSGFMTGLLVLAAGLSSPFFGVLQDKYGRRALLLSLSCGGISFGILLCFIAISTVSIPVVSSTQLLAVALFLIALGFSAAPVTLLSSLSLVVDEIAICAALGLYKATENAGMAVLHVSTGALRDASGSYLSSFLLLAAVAGSGIIAASLLQSRCEVLARPANESHVKDIGVFEGTEALE